MRAISNTPRLYWPPYTPMKMDDCRPSIVRGEGVYLYDDTGRRYIDGISGSYNHCLGHSHFGLIAAVKEQVDTLVHACNISSNTVLPEALAERISGKLVKARLVHTFLVMSGSEGVEAALKMAWQYQINRGCPQRTKVVAIDGAYHGCTLGAMIATRREFINEGAALLLAAHSIAMPIPSGLEDISHWRALLAEQETTIAAIVVEPVMAMAGTRQFPDGFLRELSALAKKYDIPFICDEVYCGVGRTGAFCESINQGASPDIVILSKCLGGGFPITAVVTTADMTDSFAAQSMPLFRHGHTQSGNLLGCRAAFFILDYLDSHRSYEVVAAGGSRLLQGIRENLQTTNSIVSVQGKGLMLSITFETSQACTRAQLAVRRQGVIVGAADRHLKLAPSFLISEPEADELTDRLVSSIRSVSQQ
ncbi:Adenosylmethionine-8-amino-7-oxononanoate aminotransferase [Pseudomonas amygdali pv. lachrymans]|nr:Adenosylmethionine-8-amino-7-oxononanoate aminotransferase [Pseudomonas amygdali pv. lachrymans]